MSSVPTVDLRHLDAQALATIDDACRDHGFFLLTGHGLDRVASAMWRAAAAFFSAPRADRLAVFRSADNPFGYYDRELTKQKRDQKEVFDFQVSSRASSIGRQRWPDGLPEFQPALTAFFNAATALSGNVLQLVCQAMGAAPDALDSAFGDRHTSTARLNFYPAADPLSGSERDEVNALGDMALHHHTDPGAITLLLQDDVGGLQTLSADGWIDVPANPDALVVNMGDVMQVWTNDRYRAAVHRVRHMQSGRARYSTPYFYQPASSTVVEPLRLSDGSAAHSPHYRPFSWRDYIQGRIDDNYSDLGQDDIQITRYRVA